MEHFDQVYNKRWTEMDDRMWPRSYRIGPVVGNIATKEEVVFKC